MSRHFRCSIADTGAGFAVEVREVDATMPRRTLLFDRESATSTPDEIADVVREAIVEMYRPIEPVTSVVSSR